MLQCAIVKKKKWQSQQGCVFAWWLVVRGTGPELHKVQPTQTLRFRSNLTPPLPPHSCSGMPAGLFFFFFLQEMKRSSVRRASEALAPSHRPLHSFPSTGGRRGRSRTSSRLAFEVWEVKITGTASHLNRRFHLPGQIKGPAAGVRLP